jgi:hypothetical protein
MVFRAEVTMSANKKANYGRSSAQEQDIALATGKNPVNIRHSWIWYTATYVH